CTTGPTRTTLTRWSRRRGVLLFTGLQFRTSSPTPPTILLWSRRRPRGQAAATRAPSPDSGRPLPDRRHTIILRSSIDLLILGITGQSQPSCRKRPQQRPFLF